MFKKNFNDIICIWDITKTKYFLLQVVTPKKFNDVYLYDMPPSRCSPVTAAISRAHSPRDQSNELDYDIPPRAIPVTDGAFRNCPRCSPQPPLSCISPVCRDSGEAYDVPRSLISKYLNNSLKVASHQRGPSGARTMLYQEILCMRWLSDLGNFSH